MKDGSTLRLSTPTSQLPAGAPGDAGADAADGVACPLVVCGSPASGEGHFFKASANPPFKAGA